MNLTLVKKVKYLGFIISDDLCNGPDLERSNTAFLKQFYSLYRRFDFNDCSVLLFLFQSHCTSFYGAELWSDLYKCQKEFDQLGVSYHKCIKKVMHVPPWENNHDICERAGVLLFKHLINKKIISFVFNIIKSKSPCMTHLKLYIRYYSKLKDGIRKTFRELYDIEDVLDNDLDAVIARINFVQSREVRRYCIF